ncbi:hypothetical protein CCACVL1_21063 [Corchorus capsularis]|uniref:Uncharacterized protein n=1 Tax=Corchorus capsularis TaxID=210143 RepID=A0A1R3H8C9_COCAP|nr:hypothetical protein CCACVL1_21063 [Corchorus capsularis]
MEGSKVAMLLIAYLTILAVFATGATAVREDLGAIAPSPMESAGAALGVPAALAAAACMLAWFF